MLLCLHNFWRAVFLEADFRTSEVGDTAMNVFKVRSFSSSQPIPRPMLLDLLPWAYPMYMYPAKQNPETRRTFQNVFLCQSRVGLCAGAACLGWKHRFLEIPALKPNASRQRKPCCSVNSLRLKPTQLLCVSSFVNALKTTGLLFCKFSENLK